MSTEDTTALVKHQGKSARRWLRTLITLGIIAVVAALGYIVLSQTLLAPKQQSVQDVYSIAQVRRDTLEIKVQGTGNISSAKSYDIISSQPGKIEQLNFEQGDIVDEGALLYEISNQDLEDTVTRAKNELKQSRITTEKQKNTLPGYFVDAPATGVVKKLKAKLGEDAAVTCRSFGALCYISTEGKMKATITPNTKTTYVVGPTTPPDPSATPTGSAVSGPFDNVIEIRTGDWIYLLINSQTYFARVTSATQASIICEMQTDAFEIGTKVEAYEYQIWGQKIGEGTLELVDPVPVTGSGILTNIYVTEGTQIIRGQRMFDMDTKDVDLSMQSQNLTRQLTQQQIDENVDKLNDNKLYIPHGGVLSQLNVKAGQNISGGMLIGTIIDFKDQEITLDVDELDIPKVAIGQAVDIRVDALPDDEFSGKVKKIGELGTTSGGMTTYPVTISLNYDDKIRIGMSASADVLVDKHENTLIVPLEAIHSANGEKFVMVLEGGEASVNLLLPRAQSGAQAQQPGAAAVIERRVVTLGLTNESYAEITSGLEEGDVVLSPKSSSSAASSMQAMMFGGRQQGGQVQRAAPQGGTNNAR